MKHRLRYAIAGLLTGGALVLTPAVSAMVYNNSHAVLSDSTTTTDTSSSSASTDDTAKIETNNKNVADRIAQFKTKFKIDLTTAEQSNLKLHCVAAQVAVGKLDVRFVGNVAIRTKAYTDLQARLTKLITNLKAKSVDTTTLEQEQTALNAKITTYNTDLTAYKQSLSDLKTIDCKTDPNGFKAALEAARSAHDSVAADATDIRSYLVGTINPTLQSILKTLETSTTN